MLPEIIEGAIYKEGGGKSLNVIIATAGVGINSRLASYKWGLGLKLIQEKKPKAAGFMMLGSGVNAAAALLCLGCVKGEVLPLSATMGMLIGTGLISTSLSDSCAVYANFLGGKDPLEGTTFDKNNKLITKPPL